MPLSIRENMCRQHRLPRNDDILRARARFLTRTDQDLVDAILIRGQSARSVARLAGTGFRPVGDRVRYLARKLASRRFMHVVRALRFLSRDDARLAIRAFCQDASHADIGREFGLTAHAVRRRLDAVTAQIDLVAQTPQLSGPPLPDRQAEDQDDE